MKKTISTLIPDIEEVLRKGVKPSEEHLDLFAEDCKEALRINLTEGCTSRPPNLRMSNLGQPDRKLWYTINNKGQSTLSPTLLLMFTYGHIIEAFMLLLARHAGHEVTEQQKKVVLDGVVGHKDCRIDGITTDVKGMSNYGFEKFNNRTIFEEDDYGYIMQISGYTAADGDTKGAFFVFDKARARMCLLELDHENLHDARERVKHIRVVLEHNEPPNDKCYPLEEVGKSGNLALGKNCSWCEFKEECWKDANDGRGLRKFRYASGIKYLTKVEKVPNVFELGAKVEYEFD